MRTMTLDGLLDMRNKIVKQVFKIFHTIKPE